MANSPRESARYPLLEAVLEQRGLQLKGIYTVRDAAAIFAVSRRTIQEWVRDGKLVARELPGRGRFLSDDLELFLQRSLKERQQPEDQADLGGENGRGQGRNATRQTKRRQYGM